MVGKLRISFRKTSLLILSVYALCLAILLANAVNIERFYGMKQLMYLILLWALTVMPQFILLLYVYNFQTRWPQLLSVIVQIIAFISALYYEGKILLLMNHESQPLEHLFYLPIWQCVTILAFGLIMKLIQEYRTSV